MSKLTNAALLSACDAVKADAPVCHSMPCFDQLAQIWAADHCSNGFIRDEFSIWCDVQSKATYALIEQVGGFFRLGSDEPSEVLAGGLVMPGFIPDPDYAAAVAGQVAIAGYKWEQDGSTWLLGNEHQGEAWADCDDWLFSPFYFSEFQADGSLVPPPPPGMCRCIGPDGEESFRALPDLEELQQRLFNLGARRPDAEIEQLEALYRA